MTFAQVFDPIGSPSIHLTLIMKKRVPTNSTMAMFECKMFFELNENFDKSIILNGFSQFGR